MTKNKQLLDLMTDLSFRIEASIGAEGIYAITLSDQGKGVFFHSQEAFLETQNQFENWLMHYLKGNSFPLPKHTLKSQTPFTLQVLNSLLEIPYGTQLSYSALAEKVGRPKAVRACGSACGRNPLPLLYPCHRVLRSDSTLGGFSQGLQIKKLLLTLEN